MIRNVPISAIVACAISLFACGVSSHAAIVITNAGVTIVENFDSYRGLGFSATPGAGQLDSTTYRAIGFDSGGPGAFGGEFVTDDYARGISAGGESTGGGYAFEVSPGDYTLGVQPTDADFTPGSLTIRIQNQTGATLNGLNITANAMIFNDQDRSTEWNFQGSLDDTNYFTFDTLFSPEARDANAVWDSRTVGGVIPLGPGVADGGFIFVRVFGDDEAGSGSRDEFALNNLSITGITAIPEPTSVAALCAVLGGAVLFRRGRRRVSLTGN